jgi:16S rRNA (cytosine967-C5)-methyltransferase
VRLRSGFAISEDLELEALELDLPWQFYICKNLSRLLESGDFAAGKFYIQDPAPAHVAQLLKNHAELLPEKINFIDLCAAPGGKFIMNMELLESLGKTVDSATASYRSQRRLELLGKNMLRCKIKGSVQAKDAADPAICQGRTYELVTCDVPCSNSGVFRRRPDALWHWSSGNMPGIVSLQSEILNNAAGLTAVNGLLLYSTCSLEAEENSLQISKFLETHREFELVEEQLFMPQTFCDGTYAALLRKTD